VPAELHADSPKSLILRCKHLLAGLRGATATARANQHFCRNAEALVEVADHLQREQALSHFGHKSDRHCYSYN